MKLLLDTHAFIWFIEGNSKLSGKAKALIEASDNQRFLSIASLWEMTIKKSLGKLELGMDMQTLIDEHISQNAMEILPIDTSALFILQDLPFHHKDPVDRLIISQSLADDLVLLSIDEHFSSYQVNCVW
ncbi:MAG: PIN domain-containing protein [Methylococcaceae bacterium]|nr:PIN domain-containing protein [Methylococcaceae bacterium]